MKSPAASDCTIQPWRRDTATGTAPVLEAKCSLNQKPSKHAVQGQHKTLASIYPSFLNPSAQLLQEKITNQMLKIRKWTFSGSEMRRVKENEKWQRCVYTKHTVLFIRFIQPF